MRFVHLGRDRCNQCFGRGVLWIAQGRPKHKATTNFEELSFWSDLSLMIQTLQLIFLLSHSNRNGVQRHRNRKRNNAPLPPERQFPRTFTHLPSRAWRLYKHVYTFGVSIDPVLQHRPGGFPWVWKKPRADSTPDNPRLCLRLTRCHRIFASSSSPRQEQKGTEWRFVAR